MFQLTALERPSFLWSLDLGCVDEREYMVLRTDGNLYHPRQSADAYLRRHCHGQLESRCRLRHWQSMMEVHRILVALVKVYLPDPWWFVRVIYRKAWNAGAMGLRERNVDGLRLGHVLIVMIAIPRYEEEIAISNCTLACVI